MNRYDNLPQELRDTGKFNVWRYVPDPKGKKPKKVPYNPKTGGKGQSNNPGTFADFQTALSVVDSYDGLGIGAFDDLLIVDFDDCVKERQITKPEARYVMETMDCYTEISPSGTGLRMIAKASGFDYDTKLYYIHNQKLGLEIYLTGKTNKFLTVTGDVIRTKGIEERGEQLRKVFDRYMRRPVPHKSLPREAKSMLSDEGVLEKAMSAKNGEDFLKLWHGDTSGYASPSEADMGLASHLAFWCGGDIGQMDRLFRESGLMRDKWDRVQSGTTYGRFTLEKAVGTCAKFYTPGHERVSAFEDFREDYGLEALKPDTNPRYEWNDIGAGNLFADVFKSRLRYVPERKCWYWYDGSRWKQDVGNLRAMEMCKGLFEQLMVYAFRIQDERRREQYVKYVARWSGRGSRMTIIADAQSVYPISMSEFDANPYVFNCANVTLFLTEYGVKAREHSASDLLTKISPVVYNPSARYPRWDRFILEIMSEDTGRARFLQKAHGYGLSGDTTQECLFVYYGATTRNGKGTACESILCTMGDYGCTSRPEMLGMKPGGTNSGAPSEELARLNGIRFNNISEPGKGLVLNAALVKTLTGNDTINARFLHENSFDFKPQFKIFINTNHLPAVNDMTLFLSGRVFIVPFERHFDENEQDKSLKQEFAKPEAQSAILNWLIEGWRLYKAEGLEAPDAVKAATESYRRESDKIGLFIEECLEAAPDAEVRTSDVYTRYRWWCAENGYFTENTRNFKQSLQAMVRIERKRPRSGGGLTTLVVGQKLVSEFLDE